MCRVDNFWIHWHPRYKKRKGPRFDVAVINLKLLDKLLADSTAHADSMIVELDVSGGLVRYRSGRCEAEGSYNDSSTICPGFVAPVMAAPESVDVPQELGMPQLRRLREVTNLRVGPFPSPECNGAGDYILQVVCVVRVPCGFKLPRIRVVPRGLRWAAASYQIQGHHWQPTSWCGEPRPPQWGPTAVGLGGWLLNLLPFAHERATSLAQ